VDEKEDRVLVRRLVGGRGLSDYRFWQLFRFHFREAEVRVLGLLALVSVDLAVPTGKTVTGFETSECFENLTLAKYLTL